MRIGILGSGDVAKSLGAGFLMLGHQVKLGSRSPAKLGEWVGKSGPKASSGTFAEAAEFGELAVLATLWSGTENALELAGPGNLSGKVVLDATNPLAFSTGGPPGLALGHKDSGGEQVQRWLPDSMVVKAFNTVGHAHMVRPSFPGGPPDMFLCGNDEGARRTVGEFCSAFGWGVVDLGGIEAARLLEPLAMVWILHGIRGGSWNHAFKFLRR
ncbi:MAG: NAD(P)-binding domain-containing protein [Myxococcales bacterium]|nr:NAD(P)-binding domain-containing protein [Myxococcales bacterium]